MFAETSETFFFSKHQVSDDPLWFTLALSAEHTLWIWMGSVFLPRSAQKVLATPSSHSAEPSALPRMSKHFHCNESLFPGWGAGKKKKKRHSGQRWGGGRKPRCVHTWNGADAHMQRRLERALLVSCLWVWELEQRSLWGENAGRWFALMKEEEKQWGAGL